MGETELLTRGEHQGILSRYNYNIIQDEKLLSDFVDSLPETALNEKYYITLLARKKYGSHITADRSQLKRVLANKEHVISKIRQLECKKGCYTFNGQPIPEESLAVYIMPNPRDLRKATKNSLIRFANLLCEEGNSGWNPYSEVISEVQKARSRGIYLDFDFDQEAVPNLTAILNKEAYRILKTRGGYHVVVEVDKIGPEFKKTFHQALMKLGPDVTGDCLLPIPGCIQGGFVPYFL